MTTLSFKTPLMGARFRPPAETIVSLLSPGTALLAWREPDNAHDPNAIAIGIAKSSLSPDVLSAAEEDLRERYPDQPPEDFLPEILHLGYVAREIAATWRETLDKDFEKRQAEDPEYVNPRLSATLNYLPTGGLSVTVEV